VQSRQHTRSTTTNTPQAHTPCHHPISNPHFFLNPPLFRAAASMKKPTRSLRSEKASKNCPCGVPVGKPYPNQSALCNAADQGR
jgi:hypothetical protein